MPRSISRSFRAALLTGCVAALSLLLSGAEETRAQDLSWASEAFGDSFDGFSSPKSNYSAPAPQYTFGPKAFPSLMQGGPRPVIEPIEPERIALAHGEPPGTVLIDTQERRLYLTLEGDEALLYPISVGRDGFTWTGTEKISRIAEWPDWYPPKEMRQRDPRLPVKMHGGIRNPLGAVAMFLGNTLYRIHGTNDPKTIGQAASSGCFRMLNGHAVHLASMVDVGTTVKVMPHLNDAPASAELPPENEPDRKPETAGG